MRGSLVILVGENMNEFHQPSALHRNRRFGRNYDSPEVMIRVIFKKAPYARAIGEVETPLNFRGRKYD